MSESFPGIKTCIFHGSEVGFSSTSQLSNKYNIKKQESWLPTKDSAIYLQLYCYSITTAFYYICYFLLNILPSLPI